MKYQILFSRKNKNNISKCWLLKFLLSMQSIKAPITTEADNILIIFSEVSNLIFSEKLKK